MSIPEVRLATEDDRDRVVDTMVLGFAADPVMRWMWPDSTVYVDAMRKFVEAYGGKAFGENTAYLADGGNAAALWYAPGVDVEDEPLADLFQSTVAEDRIDDAFAVLEDLDRYHPHDEPCWFLAIIAADPGWTGRGLGAELMKHALVPCDDAGLPAYLESSNPRNISLYQRHGFEIMGEIQHGTSPVVTPMLRPARS
jgi:GNAT superfamily N-acetyltransferase